MSAGIKTSIKVVRKRSTAAAAIQRAIRRDGRQAVIKHVLGGASAVYQVYPVGPPHTDGTPHTRDTFQVVVNGQVIAENGHFWTTTAIGHKVEGDTFVVAFRAAGAAFFVEWGTIYMESRPILREMVKQVRANIGNELRSINTSVSKM